MNKKLSENILLIDKPKGVTSFDVIRILRKKLGIRKMGHAGTLDPLASGLMIVAIGEGTKKLADYLKLDKSYVAEILLGTKTDTGDMEGKILESREVLYVEEDYIREVLKNFKGVFDLPVPKYSAIKVSGRALYDYARAGEETKIPIKPMEVFRSKFLSVRKFQEGFILEVEFDVASGVYIRSLAEFLGDFLDAPATLFNLRRTRIGDFDLKQAKKLEK